MLTFIENKIGNSIERSLINTFTGISLVLLFLFSTIPNKVGITLYISHVNSLVFFIGSLFLLIKYLKNKNNDIHNYQSFLKNFLIVGFASLCILVFLPNPSFINNQILSSVDGIIACAITLLLYFIMLIQYVGVEGTFISNNFYKNNSYLITSNLSYSLSLTLSFILIFKKDIFINIFEIIEFVYFVTLVFGIKRQNWIANTTKSNKISLIILSLITIIFNLTIYGKTTFESSFGVYINEVFPFFYYFISLSSILGIVYASKILYIGLITLPSTDYIEQKSFELKTLSDLISGIQKSYDVNTNNVNLLSSFVRTTGAAFGFIKVNLEGKELIESEYGISKEGLKTLYSDEDFSELLTSDLPANIHLENNQNKFKIFKSHLPYSNFIFYHPIKFENTSGFIIAVYYQPFSPDKDSFKLFGSLYDSYLIALSNAIFFQKTIDLERYKQELTLARDMQQKLLPDVISFDDRFDIECLAIPAEDVGGDIYIKIESSFGIIIVIADVSGKGLEAAFAAALFKGAVMAASHKANDLKELVAITNSTFYRQFGNNSYLTANFLSLNKNDDTFSFVRAGHLPLYCINNGKIEIIKPTGLGLGLVDGEMFIDKLEIIKFNINKYEKIIMISDGVTDAQNIQEERFDFINFLETKSKENNISSLVDNLKNDLATFTLNKKQNDDITIVALTKK